MSELRMKRRGEAIDNRESIIRSARNRRAVMHSENEKHSMLKKEGVKLASHPYFTELNRTMVHIAIIQLLKRCKNNCFARSWTEQQGQHKKYLGENFHTFMARSAQDSVDLEVDCHPL